MSRRVLPLKQFFSLFVEFLLLRYITAKLTNMFEMTEKLLNYAKIVLVFSKPL